ncbi:MAG: hypothetical protein ACOVP4_01555, partial [Bacteriovoracaceae bacterium]
QGGQGEKYSNVTCFLKGDILVIKNDIDTNIVVISLISDDSGKLIQMRKVQTSALKKVLADEKFTLSDLKTGATVLVRKGNDVVKIKFSAGFDPIYGGTFEMDYLYNGIKGTRKQIDLDLRKSGQSWEVTKNNKKVMSLNVIAKRAAIVGPIGIEEIKI